MQKKMLKTNLHYRGAKIISENAYINVVLTNVAWHRIFKGHCVSCM